MAHDPAAEKSAPVRRSLSGTIRSTLAFSGRSTRRDVWFYGLASQALAAIITALAGFLVSGPDKDLVRQAIGLLLALPLPALTARRMHDAGLSRWWALLLAWPLVDRLGDLLDTTFPAMPYPVLTAGPVMWIGVAGFVFGLGIIHLVPSSYGRD